MKEIILDGKCPKCGSTTWIEQHRTQAEAEAGLTPFKCAKCGYEKYFD